MNRRYALVPCSLFPKPYSLIPIPYSLSPLQNHHDFVRGNGALAQNRPAAGAERKIDDGGGLRMAGRSAVDNQRNAVAYLVQDASRMGTLGSPLQVGRGRRDGQPEALQIGR